jgi:transcription-repair coupling factor (superfamily II helicase)
MPDTEILSLFTRSAAEAGIISAARRQSAVCCTGCTGSARSAAAGAVLEQCRELGLKACILTPSTESAEDCADDLMTLAGIETSVLKPLESDIEGRFLCDDVQISAAVSILSSVLSHEASPVIIPADAAVQPFPVPATLTEHEIIITAGRELQPHDLARLLEESHFTRMDMVSGFGEYSVRGGILDVFPFGSRRLYRIEFFGDTVESIRLFSPDSQVSDRTAERCEISRVSVETVIREVNSCASTITPYLEEFDLMIVLDTPSVYASSSKIQKSCAGTSTPHIPVENTFREISSLPAVHLTEYRYAGLPEYPLFRSFPHRDEFTAGTDPLQTLAEMSSDSRIIV